MNCTNCGGPLSSRSDVCPYCSAFNERDFRGFDYTTAAAQSADAVCPRCEYALSPATLRINTVFPLARCQKCFGILMLPGELEALLDAMEGKITEANLTRLQVLLDEKRDPNQWPVVYVKCPVCRKHMHRKAYGIRSGVIVDTCKEHGIWLDGGELRCLFRWVKNGGEIHAEFRLAEKKRLEEQYKAFAEKISQRPRAASDDFSSSEATGIFDAVSMLFGKK